MIYVAFTQEEADMLLRHAETMIIKCNQQLAVHAKLTNGRIDPEYEKAVQSVTEKSIGIYQKLYKAKLNPVNEVEGGVS